MNSNNMQFQQNLNATIQDLKIQVGQLANITIPNPKGNASVVSLRSGRELPQQAMLQQRSRPVDVESELETDS
ncbi:hypothetical protein CR513_49906, partial [Mucuna pruriens]